MADSGPPAKKWKQEPETNWIENDFDLNQFLEHEEKEPFGIHAKLEAVEESVSECHLQKTTAGEEQPGPDVKLEVNVPDDGKLENGDNDDGLSMGANYGDEDSRSELSSCPSDYADSDSSFSVVPETDNEVEEEIWEEEDAHADGFVEEEPVNDDQSSGDPSSDGGDSSDGDDEEDEEMAEEEEQSEYEPSSSSSVDSASSSPDDSSSDDDLAEYVKYTDKYYQVYPCRHIR